MSTRVTSHHINYGFRIPPIKRLEVFSSEDWENLIEEWLDLRRKDYHSIDRLGGAGDMGRDVIAYVDDPKTKEKYIWDCYQCKHYDEPLMPSMVYNEFGKILYYTYKNIYPIPRNYYFVAPKGCGTTLSSALNNPNELKKKVTDNWDKYCKNGITDKESIELQGDFQEYVRKFDFTIFNKIPPKVIIEEHSQHPNHLIRFGGGLPDRAELDENAIPNEILLNELTYVEQLLLAYGSDCALEFIDVHSLAQGDSKYQGHFKKARISFHHAEQLRNFSRDNLPNGVFEQFQNEIYHGIENLFYQKHESGFTKVLNVENHASIVQISSNPLIEVLIIKDRTGVCHQLVNDGRIKWV